MLKKDKEQVVERLAARIKAAETLIVADYRGLTNAQLEALRDELLKHGARFTVVKNTLTRRAAEAAGNEPLLALLEGPTAIAFLESGGDPLATAKALSRLARDSRVLAIRGGVLEGRAISSEDIESLAKLPSTDVLRGQVLAAIVGPVQAFAGLISAPLTNLVGVIDARIAQLGGEDEPEPEAPIEETTPEAPAAEEETTTQESADESGAGLQSGPGETSEEED
ncbi:MAG: 50S ribosomal protein L10 [Gaiellaceae bacterium]